MLAGFAIAVGFPTLFWTLLAAPLAGLAGIALSGTALVAVGAAVAVPLTMVWCALRHDASSD